MIYLIGMTITLGFIVANDSKPGMSKTGFWTTMITVIGWPLIWGIVLSDRFYNN